MSKKCLECFRRENTEFLETHATKSELAKLYKVSRYTIESWQKKYRDKYPKPVSGVPSSQRGIGNSHYFNKVEVEQFLLWRSGQDRVAGRTKFTKPRSSAE